MLKRFCSYSSLPITLLDNYLFTVLYVDTLLRFTETLTLEVIDDAGFLSAQTSNLLNTCRGSTGDGHAKALGEGGLAVVDGDVVVMDAGRGGAGRRDEHRRTVEADAHTVVGLCVAGEGGCHALPILSEEACKVLLKVNGAVGARLQ